MCAAKNLHSFFRYLNRHWIKRELDEGKKNIYDVYTLHLVLWRDDLRELLSRVRDNILEQIERNRNNSSIIESSQAKQIIDSFVSLGVDENNMSRPSFDFYKLFFVEPFIKTTKKFYLAENKQLKIEKSIAEYMTKAEMRIGEETTRMTMFLYQDITYPLQECITAIIGDHTHIFKDKFQVLLDENCEEGMKRMYKFLVKTYYDLTPFIQKFEEYIVNAGIGEVKGAVHDAENPQPRPYVEALLKVHNRFQGFVKRGFNDKLEFTQSLNNACSRFINENKACKQGSNKSAKLLAKYIDDLLQNSIESEKENEMTSAMTIFKYIEDKDDFQRFYLRMLTRRLLQSNSLSIESEKSMISKLRDTCGFEYTSKFQRMIRDIEISKDLESGFQEYTAQHHGGSKTIDSSYSILSSNSWSLQLPNTGFNPPSELSSDIDLFNCFYMDRYTGRKLTYLWHFCKGELTVNYCKSPKKRYTFHVFVYQMAILLLFNEKEANSYKDIQLATKLECKVLRSMLSTLVEAKVLQTSPEDGSEMFRLNYDFKNKKSKVMLNQGSAMVAEVKKPKNNIAIKKERNLLQCNIVRIMNARKRMKYIQLVRETIDQVKKSRFTPQAADIERCINDLLKNEYLERLEEDEIRYLASNPELSYAHKTAPATEPSSHSNVPRHPIPSQPPDEKTGAILPHTCEHCKILALEFDEGSPSQGGTTVQHVLQGSNTFSGYDAREGARSGCSFCSWILYPSRIDWDNIADIKDYKLYFKYRWTHDSYSPRQAEIMEFGFKKKTEYEAPKCRKRSCRFIVYEESDPSLPKVQISAEESFQHGKILLNECLACKNSYTTPLPQRVIKIDRDGKDWKLILVEGSTETGPYAALSYSWGGNQEFITTADTLKERKKGINFNLLPKTIQDAIQVSFELGIHYIWVDSLCILQDNNDDRRREFLHQDLVYSGALFTIAASRAGNHREGFLNDIVFKLQKRSQKSLMQVILWKLNPPDSQEPLSERAWAYQEYILSNRILFFESYRLRWACSCDTHGWNTYEKDWFQNLSPVLGADFDDGQPGRINRMDWTDARQCIEEWYEHIQRFSRRKITKIVDKLPAIMGALLPHYRFLGKPPVQSGTLFPDSYPRECKHPLPEGVVAGLLWFTVSNNPRKLCKPSWSWTSSEGHIDMSYCIELLGLRPDPDLAVVSKVTHQSRNPEGMVFRKFSSELMSFYFDGRPIGLSGPTLAAKMYPGTGGEDDNDNKTVQVMIGGNLTVNSKRILLDIDLWSDLSGQNNSVGTSWQASEYPDLQAELFTNDHIPKNSYISENSCISVTLLRMYYTGCHESVACMIGLILIHTSCKGKYIRIGVFEFKCNSDNGTPERNVWDSIDKEFKQSRVTLI